MNTERLLSHVLRVIDLTEEEKNIFTASLKIRQYLKGQFIEQAGDISRYQNFVHSGIVKNFYIDQDGNEHIVTFGIEDWWCGDICSFTTQTPAEFHTQCLADSTIIQISYENVERLYLKIPKLERYFRLIVQKAYGNMSKRIVRNHSMPAKDRYIQFIDTYPEIARQVPQYLIASYLGITKEFLSNIRKQIASEK